MQGQHEDEWFYGQGGDRKGPISRAKLEAMAASGELQPNSLVWTHGWSDWLPASEVQGLLPAAPPPFGSPAGAPVVVRRPGQGVGLQEESIALLIILAIFTCGLYPLYAFWRAGASYVRASEGVGSAFSTLLLGYVLSFLGGGIGMFLWAMKMAFPEGIVKAMERGVDPNLIQDQMIIHAEKFFIVALVLSTLTLLFGLAALNAALKARTAIETRLSGIGGGAFLTAPLLLMIMWGVPKLAKLVPVHALGGYEEVFGLASLGLGVMTIVQGVLFFVDHNKLVQATRNL